MDFNNKKFNTIPIHQAALERYSSRFKIYGENAKSLGWGSLSDQILRFSQVAKLLPNEIEGVLDIGCGFADLLNYFLTKKINFKNYCGIDITEEFIKVAINNYSKKDNIEFYISDLENFNSIKSKNIFSTSIMLGLLNFNLGSYEKNMKYTKHMIEKAFSFTKDTLIVDFLSINTTETYPKETKVFYHDPSTILNFALTLTPKVKIIHDYKPIPQREFLLSISK